ncbi:uncharacterized protein [Drosophila tropicalis]|uniref:uncharacterized protein n=1 Tax=Drosophila tropicalis TaxID=46794 RepID=UPI0035ABB256
MNPDISYSKLKILFINVFCMLYKAAALNIYRLYADLREAKTLINSSKQELWIRQAFIFLLMGLILLRFVLCFVGLASNIVAIYPILTNAQPEMLLPTIIVQSIDNVILNVYEVILGYGCLTYLYPYSLSLFIVFLAKMSIKIIGSLSILNIYTDQQTRLIDLAGPNQDGNSTERDSINEFEISSQNF